MKREQAMKTDEFFTDKMKREDGEALWSQMESSLVSNYRFEGDLQYFLEWRRSDRGDKCLRYHVPVNRLKAAKTASGSLFDFTAPEAKKMMDWLGKKAILGDGKTILLILKSYDRRPDAKTAFTAAYSGVCTLENIGERMESLLRFHNYFYFPESHYFCYYDSENEDFEFIPL